MARYLVGRRADTDAPLEARRAFEAATSLWGVDWFVLRVACSVEFHATPAETRRLGCPHLLEAHAALDALDVARAAAERQAKTRSGW